jgi:hypothetical protein
MRNRSATLMGPMSRWRCAIWALLAGCVNLSPPPGLTHPVDASAIELDGSDSVDQALGADVEVDPTVDGAVDEADQPDLPPVEPDASPPDAPLVMNGRPCSAGPQCESGQCVDGVCCSGACSGLCQACNVPGSLGTCVPVSAGQDPDDECPQDLVSTCGRDGTCNGQGGCSRYRETTECAPGGCTGDKESAASTCNGAGVCVPGKTISCSPNVCMNGSCATSCSKQADCLAGFFCDGTACRTKRTAGQTCAMAFECASGNCIDGVCCNTPCTESCHSCALPSALGTCTPVPSGMDPRDNCLTEAPATCGRTGTCDGKGGCLLHPMGTACGSGQSCTGTAVTAASACNGLGVCAPGATTQCTAYRCAGNDCGTTCAGPGQCRSGFACTGTSCVALPAPALYWKLDEASGTLAADTSGNNLNGTYIGTTGMPSPSPMVPALSFPDPSSRAFLRANRHAVTLANMPALIKPASDVTISVWFRATTVDTGPGGTSPPGSELVSAGDNYLMRLHSADIELSKRTSSGHMMCLGPVTNHLDGAWHHVGGVITASAMIVYVDGVQRASCPLTLPIFYDRGKDLFVGRHGNDTASAAVYDFEGNIDEVRIYTKSLGPTEIAALAAGN